MWLDLHQLEKFIAHQTTRAETKASNPHYESQLSRINVSIVAAHSQIVPPRRITSSIHGPEALAGQIAVT